MPTLDEILVKDLFELLSDKGKEYIKNLIKKYDIENITIPAAVLFNPHFSHLEKLGVGILREMAKTKGAKNVDLSDEEFEEMLHTDKGDGFFSECEMCDGRKNAEGENHDETVH